MRTAPPGIGVFKRPPRWLTNALDGNQVAETLRELPGVRAAGHLCSCRAVDLRLSRSGWSVWYDVVVAGVNDGSRMIPMTGSLDPAGISRSRIREGSAAGQVLPFGDNAWSATLPGLGLTVRTAAGDEGLTALALLADPARARAMLERALDEEAYPGIRISACEPQVVRYARGSRITFVVPLRYGPDAEPDWPRVVVAKAYRGAGGARAFTAMRALWHTELSSGRVVTIAEPLAYLAEHRVLVQRKVPANRTLTDLVVAAAPDGRGPAMDQLRQALCRTADGLVALHACNVQCGEVRTPAAMFDRLSMTLGHLARTVPSVAGVADQLVVSLERRAHDVSGEPPRPAHGSFRPAQVLVRESGVAFIDFDGSCMAEPAFDIGRFRARLREVGLAAPGGRHPPQSRTRRAVVDELAELFLGRYAEQSPVSIERVALWEDLELTMALVHTWPRGQLSRIPALLSLLGQRA